MGKNVKHEKTEGFYQSPEITLERKLGNCCSQTNLFLQMCDALGILKKHKAYFVHTGNMKFKERHFFAVIDNIVIDVDSHPTSPWGHANFKSGGIFSMTLFPKLPLPKNY